MAIIAEYFPTDHRYQLGTLDVALLLSVLNERGINTTPLLKSTGLEKLDWQNPQCQITYSDKLVLFGKVNRIWGNDGLGLTLGELAKFRHFGVLGYAILSSQSVEEAVKTGFKYLRLNGPVFAVKVTNDDDIASIRIKNTLDIGELLPFCTEYFLSAIASLFEEMTNVKLDTIDLHLPYAEPTYADQYQDRFRCQTHFNSTQFELRFDASILQRPLKSHHSDTLKTCLKSCDAIMNTLESPHLLTNQIKAMLYQSAGGFPSIEDIAAHFGCSSRTLRRDLAKHDTGFQALLNQVRCELAKEYLIHTELSVDEIAHRLDYSDATNFRRGFKNWTGRTPQTFRTSKR
ncbi:AraC family transcriptional regulator [Vibrio sp. S9_S30]|uniref:AraC family transcriptional regulator n=1 Tax=Vibrio sp. S9_S30 TaxID=2720226 RepID=UPI001681065B|nr:AraC family transcriptional regulator [Vibrio sp. S9_S30]MBD1557820.1 AraC family transcriptional regulator [Vibrio sp. S9_S30]